MNYKFVGCGDSEVGGGGSFELRDQFREKLTLLFVLGNTANTSLLWGLACKTSNRGKSLFYCEPVWLEGTVLCVWLMFIQDLGSDQNTLNQLGPNEGHFALSFILYIGEMPGLQGSANRAKDQKQHNTQ